MTKYDLDSDFFHNATSQQLLWIANELAEQNRLKRLEMLNSIPSKFGEAIKEELEDQA